METNVQDLLNKYEEIYLSRSRDFNALTTVHLSENDHTNILREILNMQVNGKKPFMESFVRDVLGIEYNDCNKLVAKTQIAGIGNEEKGFIDLLIDGDNLKIVIENKVCGAPDMPYQLSRYYFSFVQGEQMLLDYFDDKRKDENFCTQCRKYWKNGGGKASEDGVYLVYLTETADKIPDKKSIPEDMRDALSNKKHYIPISYEEHIYDWLKTKVLSQVTDKTSNAYMSIILYLCEMENIFTSNAGQNQWYLETSKSFIAEIYKAENNIKKYETLDAIYKDLKTAAKKKVYKENSILTDLIYCVLCWRNNVFGQFAPEGWIVYYTGTYIKFYPAHWKKKYGANIHFLFNNGDQERVTIFDFNIQNDACKKYIHTLSTDVNYNNALDTMKTYIKDFLSKKRRATISFDKSKTTINWHLGFDYQIIENGIGPWNPDKPNAFFEAFVKLEQIRNLVKYVDDNFK